MVPVIESLLDPEDVERVRAPLERGWTLPPHAYTEPRVFELEVDSIFSRDWICVARTDQVKQPGDFVCVDLPGQPIIVTRDRQGKLNAFSRVCLHRAMILAEGRGNTTRLTCPYHNWTYELDGELRSAPMMEGALGFTTAGCRLPALRTEVWQGFVFVNLDADATPLAPQLARLTERLSNYAIDQLVIADTIEFDSPWNWKILVENFMEAYHHIGTHKDTFEPIYPARDATVDDNDGAPWMLLDMPGVGEEEGGLPPLPGLSERERRTLLAITVYPTLLFGVNASAVFWYQIEPTAYNRMTLRIHVLLPAAVRDALSADDISALSEAVRFIHVQDIEVNEGPWRGLNASMTRQGRLSLHEKAIWQLNQRWLDELGM